MSQPRPSVALIISHTTAINRAAAGSRRARIPHRTALNAAVRIASTSLRARRGARHKASIRPPDSSRKGPAIRAENAGYTIEGGSPRQQPGGSNRGVNLPSRLTEGPGPCFDAALSRRGGYPAITPPPRRERGKRERLSEEQGGRT